MNLHQLAARLYDAWSPATSSDPANWTEENPSWGQCAVTACLVQDVLGGDVVWGEAKLPDGRAISHYFNRVDGDELDFTRAQFPTGTLLPAGGERRKTFNSTRDYVLSSDTTRARYDELTRRFATS